MKRNDLSRALVAFDPEEAPTNVQEAIASWIEAANEWKMDIAQLSPPMARAG
jgi:hypothetical protein